MTAREKQDRQWPAIRSSAGRAHWWRRAATITAGSARARRVLVLTTILFARRAKAGKRTRDAQHRQQWLGTDRLQLKTKRTSRY